MRPIESKNAVIESAVITNDSHGVLSACLKLDYGGGNVQVFDGHALYMSDGSKHHKIFGCAGHFIWRVMEIAGVSEWSQLAGKAIRVKAEDHRVHAIGHVIKDDWFCPAEDFKKDGGGVETNRMGC